MKHQRTGRFPVGASQSGAVPTKQGKGIIEMKTRVMGFAVAALLVAAPTFRGHAEDAAAPAPAANPTTTPAATPSQPAPVSVPRPSIVPATTEPAKPATTTEPAKPVTTTEPSKPAATGDERPRRRRHYAHRHWRYAWWHPFPIYWPHLYHHRFYWSRISWFSF